MIWTTLIPLKGKATKADAKKLRVTTNGSEISFQEKSFYSAYGKLLRVKDKLSRKYIVVMYSQEQYENRKLNKLFSILTKEQLAKTQII